MEWISVKDGLPEDDGTGMFHSDFVLISDGVGWDMGRLHFDSLAYFCISRCEGWQIKAWYHLFT